MSRRLPLILGALLALAVAAPAAARPHDEPRTTLGILTPLIGLGAPDVIAEARALGVDTVRLSQDVANPTVRPALHVVQREGLQLLLTVTNAQERDAQGNRPGHPPVTPEELAAYRRRLGSLLDALQRPPVLLQVENEEIEPRFFAGTMGQYLGELDAAVAVAHARGIRVTNGGITGRPLALLTWQHYRDRGLEAKADDFARRAFTRPQDAGVLQDLLREPFTGLRRQPLQAAWDRAKELVAAFRASRMDYVNFHWYFDDDRSLRQAVRYLRRATGKAVITTEVGQHNTEPEVVTGHLRTLVKRLRLPFVIWFDADGTPALGLHDAPAVLRPNGIAFRDFVAKRAARGAARSWAWRASGARGATPRYAGQIELVSRPGRRVRSATQGDGWQAVFRERVPGTVRYRVCVRKAGGARVRRCWSRRSGRDGRSRVTIALFVNDRGGPGHYTATWTVRGRTVATAAFHVHPEPSAP